MSAVFWVVRHRFARRWLAWITAGIVLGLGFGLCLASFNAARRTSSAYDRIVGAYDVPDVTVTHNMAPDEAARRFGELHGVREQRHYVGFIGTVDGVDPALTGVTIGPSGRRFPIERPLMREGRHARPERRDEVIVNETVADPAGLEVGQRVTVNIASPPDFKTVRSEPVTIVGIGTFPRSAVIDETGSSGIFVFTPAFVAAHADQVAYASSSLYVRPSVDPRRDLASPVRSRGGVLSEAREQGAQAVSAALRPMLTILVILGLLALVGTAIGAGQIVHRERDAWQLDDEVGRALGMTRGQTVLALAAAPAVMATIATVSALAAMTVTSPLAPLGPLHEFDPEQGIAVDPLVALLGVVVIVAVMALTSVLVLLRSAVARPARRRVSTATTVAMHPTATSGLALGAGPGRRRSRRLTGYGTAAIALVALVVTLVASAVSLSDTPSRYGFDWDVLALTPYGDHTPEGLRATFRDDPDVLAATAFTSQNLIVDGISVPGLAATPVKGRLGPTIVEGRGLRGDDEIIVGRDTIERLGVDIGDEVEVPRQASADGTTTEAADPLRLRVVGIATFPSVVQVGTDQPRLGTGVMLPRAAFDRVVGGENLPEWTAARLGRGVTAGEFIARHRDGLPERYNLPTSWYTDAKPAELRQLDAVRSLLVGAIAISVLIAVAVIGYGLWTQTRGNRRELAALGAVGFTRRQLGEAAAWQAVPLAVIVTIVGIPLGIFVGRWGFLQFARSLAVVERVVVPPWVVAALVVGALTASGIGALCAAGVARRTRIAVLLRGE